MFIKRYTKNFVKCGLIGWGLECFWTGCHCVGKKEKKNLPCKTSIWMFPIYGMASFIEPLSLLIQGKNILFRGSIYTIFIYLTEYSTGMFLKKKNCCPWDYSHSKFNYKGVIRFDYAPLWFLVGLLFEKCVLVPTKKEL